MIIGGVANSELVLNLFKSVIFNEFLFSVATEIWELENGNNKIVNPTLTNYDYSHGIGLFAVDFDFCKK